jgi:hypothetical protein
MGWKIGLLAVTAVLALLGFALAGAVAHGAASHQSGCHTQHTCPSDHHTYVWVDQTTGLAWDCVEPGAPEYDASQDTTIIVYQGLTYYCRSASGATTTTLTMSVTTTSTTIVTTATESTSTNTTITSTSTTTTTTTTLPVPQFILPDPTITPGTLNPKVRQSTIKKTICKSGWTKTIRPPVSYTNALKIKQMVLYGETGSPSEYEEDHFIPLELGGAPRNPKNLWPEPHAQSKKSDPLETQLRRKVCNGLMKLANARTQIRAFKFENG